MKAEIISIGTELLLGQIADTNAQWLAERLPALGIELYYVSQIGDNLGRLTEALRTGWSRSELIITTGGLGPTEDDVTREAIAALLGEMPAVDPQLERRLRAWFGGRGISMPERNIKQAWTLPSVDVMDNPRGTAPGWFTTRGERYIASMPGVPNEMTAMFIEQVVPRLAPRLGASVIVTRLLKTIGIGEASVEEMIDDVIKEPNPTAATYAKNDGVHIRISAKAASEQLAQTMLDDLEATIRPRFGAAIYGGEDDSLESVIGSLLAGRSLTVATMESCTTGLVCNALGDVPGSSAYLRGGIVAYAEEMKTRYGVPGRTIRDFGVVSAETATAMAEAAALAMDADVGVGTTGVAGPGEVDGIKAGTVYIAVWQDGVSQVKSVFWPRNRREVKRWATLQTLDLLRRHLLGLDVAGSR